MAKSWEEGFQSAVKVGRRGWTVTNNGGKMYLRVRGKDIQPQRVNLPYEWDASNQGNALLLINKIYGLVQSEDLTLKKALQASLKQSSVPSRRLKKGWENIALSLEHLRKTKVHQCSDYTWDSNWKPFISEALRVLKTGKVSDGHGLLEACLDKWQDFPSSRFACCLALKNFMEVAVSRHGMSGSWLISQNSIKELRGRKADRRTKFTFEDSELLNFIDSISQRNPAWGNVIRTLSLYGLRPIELNYIEPRVNSVGELQLWCSYKKVSGPNKTPERWLEPVPLIDPFGNKVSWPIPELMKTGLWAFPTGKLENAGKTRFLNGRYVLNFLQYQPEWQALKKQYEPARHVRPVSFRDSWIVRATRMGIAAEFQCQAVGHGLAAHQTAYEKTTHKTVREAFSKIQ